MEVYGKAEIILYGGNTNQKFHRLNKSFYTSLAGHLMEYP